MGAFSWKRTSWNSFLIECAEDNLIKRQCLMTKKENVPYLVDSFANGIFQLTLAKSIDYTRKIYYHKSSNIKVLGSSPQD